MQQKPFLQQIGTGVASLTFGVALSIFIYAAVSGVVTGTSAWLLYVATFLMMLRFWWRYNELFIQHLPSSGFWHFLFDFAIAFFGILAVLYVSDIPKWALISAASMVASIARCGLSWPDAKGEIKRKLRRTIAGAILVIIIMAAAYWLAPVVDITMLAAAVLALTLIFVFYSARKP